MKTIKVELTKKDIQQGRQGESTSCPIALCLKRITGIHYRVTPQVIRDLSGTPVASLPMIATRFITTYDNASITESMNMKPISFQIQIKSI